MSTEAQRAFLDRIDRHRAILIKVGNAYCRNPFDREDLAAEIVAQLWRAYERFDGRSSFSTWMYRVAINVAISFVRSETRKRRLVDDKPAVLESIASPAIEHDDRSDLLRELIDDFNPLDRALMLLYLDDYPYAEIAAILGISETNVATKLGRIKDRLKRSVAAGAAS
jgi:RNA polymerase sigma factor (sigma-70 family)